MWKQTFKLLDPKVRDNIIGATGKRACWLWDKGHSDKGYAKVWINKKRWYVHRFMYQMFIGRLIKGLELDHLCRNRGCVNPFHTEQVTHQVNTTRGPSSNMLTYRNKICKRGHKLEGYNAKSNKENGGTICRTCQNANAKLRARQYRARIKQGHIPDRTLYRNGQNNM